MSKNVRLAGCAIAIGLALLAPQTSFAQTTTSTGQPAASTTSDKAPNGSLQKYQGMFRTSELVGANVYDDQGSSIGTVNDLLTGDDGKIQNAVLSVGGLLGVGTHYVSVPFSQLHVEASRSGSMSTGMTNGTSGAGNANTTAGAPPPSAMAPATVSAAPNTAPMGTTAAPARGTTSTQYFSLVLPGATKDSLTKMPEFHYRA